MSADSPPADAARLSPDFLLADREEPPPEASRRIQAILENIPHLVLLLDLDGRVRTANRGLLNLDRGELAGRMLWEILPGVEEDELRSLLRSAAEDLKHVEFYCEAPGTEGGAVHLSNSVGPVSLDGRLDSLVLVSRDTTHGRRVEKTLRRLAEAVEQTHESVVITDAEGAIQYVNPAFEAITGYTREEALGENPRILKSGLQDQAFYEDLWNTISGGKPWKGRFSNRRRDGTVYIEETAISPVKDPRGRIVSYVAVKREITEKLDLEAKFQQSQKLESIGRLAAGIAHEINTPIQYVSDNTVFLKRAFGLLINAMHGFEQLLEAAGRDTLTPEALREAERAARMTKVDFLLKQVPRAVEQSIEGLERVAHIVGAMKEFSHPNQGRMQPLDLAHAIETTVTVSRNEWKYVAEVETDFDPELPPVPCRRNEINQVLLNLIVNAAQAIAELTDGGSAGKGRITIETRCEDDLAVIRIGDTGPGVPEQIRELIFEPFFTTKKVGKGTGQGLAIARHVVVEKHGGELLVESEPGSGSVFVIMLPLEQEPQGEET